MEAVLGILFASAFLILGIWLTFWLFITVPCEMAEARGRSKFFWVVFGLCTSPFASIVLLWMLGEAPGHVRYGDELEDELAAKGGQ